MNHRIPATQETQLSAGLIELYAQKHESAAPVNYMIWLGAGIYTFFPKLRARNFIQLYFNSLAPTQYLSQVKTYNLMSEDKTALTRKSTVVIYSRPGCHLCVEAKQAIAASGCAEQYTLQEINIEGNLELLEKYRYDIPVIIIDGVEAFRHHLTAEAFSAAIDKARAGEPPNSI